MKTKLAAMFSIGLMVIMITPGCAPIIQPTQPTMVATVESISSPIVESTSTTESTPTLSTKTGEIEIKNFTSNLSDFGVYTVVGEIQNNSSETFSGIELSIEIKDSAGDSLLKDDMGNSVENNSFEPLIKTLCSGESSSFKYEYDTSYGLPDTYEVKVKNFTLVEVKRITLVTENFLLVGDGMGSINISGELINPSDHWVLIKELAGAAVNENQQVIATDWTSTLSSELAPHGDLTGYDRTPFFITMTDSGGLYKGWKIYQDAIILDTPHSFDVKIELTDHYFDANNNFHLIGSISNPTTDQLSIQLTAGIYDEQSVVLDSVVESLPLGIGPNEEYPFDVSGFMNIDNLSILAEKINKYSVKVNFSNSQTITNDLVKLESPDATCTKNGPNWDCIGTVINSSGKELLGETIQAGVYDTLGKLQSTGFTYIIPQIDSIASQEINSFEFTINGNPQFKADDSIFKFFIQGTVK